MAFSWEDGLISKGDTATSEEWFVSWEGALGDSASNRWRRAHVGLFEEVVDGVIPRLEPRGGLACSHNTIRISLRTGDVTMQMNLQ